MSDQSVDLSEAKDNASKSDLDLKEMNGELGAKKLFEETQKKEMTSAEVANEMRRDLVNLLQENLLINSA